MSDSPPRTPLVNPKRYFDEADDPLPQGLAVFILHLIGLAVLLNLAVRVVYQRIQSPPAGLELQLSRMVFDTMFSALVIGCVVLLGIAAIFHYGSSNPGEFSDAVAVAAWGYAPNLLSHPFSYVLIRRRLAGDSIRSPRAMQAEFEVVQSGGGQLQILLSLAVIIWSVYILGYGIHSTHGITLQRGLVLAGFVGLFAFLGSFI